MSEKNKMDTFLSKRFAPMLAILVLGIALWWLLFYFKWEKFALFQKNLPQSSVNSSDKPIDTTLAQIKLNDSTQIDIPKEGFEAKLWDFLSQKQDSAALKQTWIDFDRLVFESGKSELMPQSAQQLDILFQMLKSKPDISVKIGAYTDNTGNPKANLKLSQDRADHVRNELISRGISASRLEAEGFGDAHPICPENDTEECRAKNRRVSLRVLAQ
ncbi:MAG: OmpA family protein [Chitinophagales bacterium]|nr:OmpA family protein [Chitinophagales bacterium]